MGWTKRKTLSPVAHQWAAKPEGIVPGGSTVYRWNMANGKKVIRQTAEGLGLDYIKWKNVACGTYQGYSVIITLGEGMDGASTLRVGMCAKKGDECLTGEMIRSFGLWEKVLKVGRGYEITLLFPIAGKIWDVTDQVMGVVRCMAEQLRANGFENCDIKGISGESSVYFSRGRYEILTEETVKLRQEEIRQDREWLVRTRKRVPLGVLCAFLASLVCILIILFLGRIERVFIISGFIMGMGVVYGYRSICRRFSVLGSILCVILTAVMTCVAFQLNIAVDLYLFRKSTMPDYTYLESVFDIKSVCGTMGYYLDLGRMMLAALACSLVVILAERSNQKDYFKLIKL